MPTAAILIIGDEILGGKFPDENAPFLVARLRALGCDLRRIVTLPDTVDEIAAEVRRCAGFDHVLTTGGVGPTHDDVTFEGVARGLGRMLVVDEALAALLDAAGLARSPTNLRMCRVPADSVLVYGGSRFPVVRAGNVWVFPGVPSLLRKKFDEVADAFRGTPLTTARRVTRRKELQVADGLAEVARRFPTVAIGSYPRWSEAGDASGPREEELVLTLESRDPEALAAALGALDALL